MKNKLIQMKFKQLKINQEIDLFLEKKYHQKNLTNKIFNGHKNSNNSKINLINLKILLKKI